MGEEANVRRRQASANSRDFGGAFVAGPPNDICPWKCF